MLHGCWFVYRIKTIFCCTIMPFSVVMRTIYKPLGSSLALNWQFCGVFGLVFPLKTFCNNLPSTSNTETVTFSLCKVLKYKFSVPPNGFGLANNCKSLAVLSLPLLSMGIQNQLSVTLPAQSVMVTLKNDYKKEANELIGVYFVCHGFVIIWILWVLCYKK